MSWATPEVDLRTLLSDGATDRYRYRKRVFGELNGTNKTFKTFEFRRITNFTTTLGVYKNGVQYALVDILSDSPATGEFTLAVATAAPVDGDLLEASYYIQWFLDAELTQFVSNASQWLGLGSTASNVPDGLIPAALKFGASEAYQKMAMRWRENLSETYRMEDAPDKSGKTLTDEYIKLADMFKKEATKTRDEFYTRQGQSLSPLFGTVIGRVRDVTPRG